MMKITIPEGTEITEARLAGYLKKHMEEAGRLIRLWAYYTGGVRVNKGEVAHGRPNNQAYTNWAKYITRTATGYFMGIAPTYAFDLEPGGKNGAAAALTRVFDANDETTVNYSIAEDMSIYGVGYDILWIDENSEIRLKELDPKEVFLIRSDTIEGKTLAAVRYYRTSAGDGTGSAREITKGELYLPDRVKPFTYDAGKVAFGQEEPNYFGDVPVSEYPNNRFGIGDFESVLENSDQYNLTLSNASDDLQSIANAYLKITGMLGTQQEDIDEMNKSRIALLAEGGDMGFVTKNLDSAAAENHKKTLRQDILMVSGVPDLSDENFAGNISGVAMQYKMWGLDQLHAMKRAGMEKGLFRRLKLIADVLNLKGAQIEGGDISDMVSIKFSKNMPRDLSPEIDNAVKLKGVVSDKTVFEQLEPATGVSPEDEAERLAEGNTAQKEPPETGETEAEAGAAKKAAPPETAEAPKEPAALKHKAAKAAEKNAG